MIHQNSHLSTFHQGVGNKSMDRTVITLIRTMSIADLKAVLEIDRLSFPLPWSERTYRYEINENPSSYMYVVEVQEGLKPKVVGYVGFWFIVDEAHISTLAVHPDYRGHGMGELLLQTAVNHAERLRAKIVTLEVRISNQTAINLYRKFVFKVVGCRPRYYRDNNEDALLMTRENPNFKH
jgi:ribosomal-protein-alanine N-acetyltransferase